MKAKADYRLALGGLVAVFFLLFLFLYPSGIVRGLSSILQPLSKTTYLLGETINMSGSLSLSGEEPSTLGVNLVVEGPQPMSQQLPTTAGVATYPSKNLKVTVSTSQGGGYGYGYGAGTGQINYQLEWTPPIYLDPPPVFKIIPDTQDAFPVPTPRPTATPEAGGPAELSSSTLAFAIPAVATPVPDPNAPASLPSASLAFDVPAAPTATAQAGVVDLPSASLAFAVPAIPAPAADPNAPADLPTTTEAFAVPVAPTPTPIAGVPELGETAKAFNIPGGSIPEGITHDGTDFYILVNGDTSDANDRVIKVSATGTDLGSFPVPSRRAEAITYLGGFLYVANNEFWPPQIMKIDPADGSKKAAWDAPNTNNIRGLANDGTRLWMANEWGNQLFKVTTSGTLLDTIWTGGWTNFAALALKDTALFTAQNEKIGAWDSIAKSSITSWFTTLVDIRGMTFQNGVLYMADAGAEPPAIYKAQPPSLIEVTQEPEGLAYNAAASEMFIVVNGTPKDKILVVDPAAPQTLKRSFDAPDSKTDDIVYLDTTNDGVDNGSLYVVSNADRKVKKLNPTTGAQITEFSGPGWTDLTSITSDGTDFYIGQKQGKEIYVRGLTGTDKGQVQDWGSPMDGYQGLTYRTLTQELISSLAEKIGRFQKANGTYLQSWTTTLSDIRGVVFIGDVLYMADKGTNKIYKASIPSGVTTTEEPQGIAYDPVGQKFYIVVDATPNDQIIVTDANGAHERHMDAPSDKIDDITYLNNKLYVADNKGSRNIRELDPATGEETNSFAPANVWWDIMSLSNDGTNLLAGVKDNRQIYKIRASDGVILADNWWGDWNDPRNDSDGLAYRVSGASIEMFAVDASIKKIVRLNSTGNYQQAWTVTTLTGMRGLVFVGDLLYMADVTTKKIYKASIPSGVQITKDPQGIAYDPVGQKFYIVVDAVPEDRILIVNADGALAPNGVLVAPSDKIDDITFLNNKLYVADNKGSRNIRELDPATGEETNSFVSPGWQDILSLSNNGTDLLAGMKDNRQLFKIRASDGLLLADNWWGDWNDPRTKTDGLAFKGSGQTAQMYAVDASIQKVVRLNNTANYQQAWKVTALADVRGLVFVGEVLYLADVTTQKIYKATIPSGIEVSKVPQGIAYDAVAQKFYIVVDAQPNDKILVVNASGTMLDSFDAPSNQIDDIVFLNNKLYVADNKQVNGQRSIRKLNPANGDEEDAFSSCCNDVTSLTTLTVGGNARLVLGERNTRSIIYLDPSNGQQAGAFWGTWGTEQSGAQGFAHRAAAQELFVAENAKIYRLDETNQSQQSWTTTRIDIRGLVFVGSTLYIADADSESVYKATIPAPVTTTTTTPLDMTTDGTYLYIVVDGTPKDKILVVNPADGSVVNDYDAPENGANAITYIGGAVNRLYVATSKQLNWGTQNKIHKVNKADGTVDQSFDTPNNWEIGALAPGFTTGTLIAGPAYDNTIFIIEIGNPQAWQQRWVAPGNNYWGWKAMAEGSLYAVSGNAFVKIALDQAQNPAVVEQATRFLSTTQDIRGIAFIGTTLYLADAVSQRILTSTAPGKSPETTTACPAGQTLCYTARLDITRTGQATIPSNERKFTLAKITQVTATIEQPKNNAAFSTPDITVIASTNDPSIKQVFLDTEVPFVVSIDDKANDPVLGNQWEKDGLWKRTDKGKAASGLWSYYYGNVPALNYETGSRTSGALTSWEFDAGPDTFLDFRTWYNTEGGLKSDQKLVQVYGTLGDVTQWWSLSQIVDFIPPSPVPPADAVPGQAFQFVPIPMARFDFIDGQVRPAFEPVHLQLGDFDGQRVRIRFFFDSMDEQINMLEGWYVDDIFVGGSGSMGKPVQRGADGKFTTTLSLADGVNTIRMKAINQYTDPPLSAGAQVQVSLDRTPPTVWFGQLQSPTKTPSQSVTVNFQEPNWSLFTLEVTNVAGTRVVSSIKEKPAGNSVTPTVSLMPGVNTLTATIEDAAGLTASVQASILLDTTAPAVTVLNTIYPVGKVSARPGSGGKDGDPVIFQLNASDNAAGIKNVVLLPPGGGNNNNNETPSFFWAGQGNPPGQMGRLPEAVRDQWGATGQFIMPISIPSGTPPGTYNMGIRVEDWAGNVVEGQVQALVAPVLSAQNIYLMPEWNLVSLPLIPDATLYAADQQNTQIKKLIGNVTGLKRVWYYDAAEPNAQLQWKIYEPGQPGTLTAMETGKGYWVFMDKTVFSMSAPLAPGLPQTPAPIPFSYVGVFLEPATVPPTYDLVAGWNLVGFHEEWAKSVGSYLAGVTYPQRLWAYVLRYDNLIKFAFEKDAPPEIILGGFASMTESSNMEPGRGYWIFLSAPGSIAP